MADKFKMRLEIRVYNAHWDTRCRPRREHEGKTKKKLNGLPESKKNKVWTDEEMNIYAYVLANTDTQKYSWLYQLENYALRKYANEATVYKNSRGI